MAANVNPSTPKNEENKNDKKIEGILKAMDDAGVTFDDLLSYRARQREKVLLCYVTLCYLIIIVLIFHSWEYNNNNIT